MPVDKKNKAIVNTIAAIFTAIFIGTCLLVTRCQTIQTETAPIKQTTRTLVSEEVDTCRKDVQTAKKKKPEKGKHKPTERRFLDESIPSGL